MRVVLRVKLHAARCAIGIAECIASSLTNSINFTAARDWEVRERTTSGHALSLLTPMQKVSNKGRGGPVSAT
jgi:hypothetical protein